MVVAVVNAHEFAANTPDDDPGVKVKYWQGGGFQGTLRAYRAHHPGTRVHMVTYRGRTVWMTDRQYAIWNAAMWWTKHHGRNSRTTLAVIARRANCSKASASRFLRRLDLWRFLDYAVLVGRKGGTWLRRRSAPFVMEPDAWLAGARHTWASRKKARDLMAKSIRLTLELRYSAFREHVQVWSADWVPGPGSTDATFIPKWG